MHRQPDRHHASLQTLVPAVAGWKTFRGALVNLLLFGFVALAGEWIVHQTEYLIEYGGRFGTEMASTSHRFYMGRMGAVAVLAMLLLMLLVGVLPRLDARRRMHLLRFLPARVHSVIPEPGSRVPWPSICRSAGALGVVQIAVYLAQENLELASLTGAWPGLWVLVAPQHATVVPLHLLVAAVGSLLLWALAVRIRGSRQAVRLVEALVRLIVAPAADAPRVALPARCIPRSRPVAGARSLRSPPLAA